LGIPGGEIAAETPTTEKSIKTVMRVISNSENESGTFNVIVRAEDANSINALSINHSGVRYYAPFVFNVDVSSSAAGAADIVLPIIPPAACRDGFIALSSVDENLDSLGPQFEG